MEADAGSWSIGSSGTGGFRLYHPAAMARARCLRRVPLRGVGTCLDAADDRRNSRRARNCSGEAGVVASVLFLVAMAGSLLAMRAGGLFVRNEQRHVVHWSVGSELSERYEHLGDVCVQVRELVGDWSIANPGLVGAKIAASGMGNPSSELAAESKASAIAGSEPAGVKASRRASPSRSTLAKGVVRPGIKRRPR